MDLYDPNEVLRRVCKEMRALEFRVAQLEQLVRELKEEKEMSPMRSPISAKGGIGTL